MRLAIQVVISMSALTLPALFSPATAQDSRTSLAKDARTGDVQDLQGTAFVRPVGGQRWTPLTRKSVLMPGDQIRTNKRGANALEVGLSGGGSLLLGPGSLAELRAPGIVGMMYGDAEIAPKKGGSIRVSGPGGFDEAIRARTVVRASDRKTEKLATAPRWLTGYRSSTTDEWMGSLVAQVDGRDVPLTVGYHKVSVDIRDQIARTTVEQSFKNTTKTRLEGVFYFPLPADASISGFGMWIGGELVEADIVEKQRARAIYEDILRRKKDPGLLEWSGGNLFKARVFPIEPHSEKRIRIRYTQVLPLQGTKVRYRYALRSELLQQHPLRELSIRVAVSSTAKLTKVASTTHECRTRFTDHTALVEFDAQEYTPDRDFEVVLEVERTQALTVVPHRRGDDGYFMLLLSPPTDSGPWQRELLGNGKPLKLVILADTSASMDRAARDGQRQFIESLLSMLGPRDSFQLMTCDVAVRSPTQKPVPVDESNIEAALEFLDARNSLGWTNVDEYVARAIAAGPDSTIIYVGDGIGTTGDADPVALAQRIRGLAAAGNHITCHAVATSSQYEKVVLEALASLGGGSVRSVGDDPAHTAFELLAETTQPTIKDLRIEFEGIRTARVYPEKLPNLPAGAQQIVLGRYLPTGKAQSGKVTVRGTLAGKPVSYTARVTLPDHEKGGSFLPRLWARRHLDALLEEGPSKTIQRDIVAFSEEFGIMTPYTSFLVLENDADRQRYGVTRRVKMRDGEQFFADARDRAKTEVLRQQMRLARTWRLDLRTRMLREIARLGKDLQAVPVAYAEERLRSSRRLGERLEKKGKADRGFDAFAEDDKARSPGGEMGPPQSKSEEVELQESETRDFDMDLPTGGPTTAAPVARSGKLPNLESNYRGPVTGGGGDNFAYGARRGRRNLRPQQQARTFESLHFPSAIPEPVKPTEHERPKWTPGILAVLDAVYKEHLIQEAGVGLVVDYKGVALHPIRGSIEHRVGQFVLLTPSSWYIRQARRGGQTIESWLDAKTRGVVASAFRTGRRRARVDRDADAWSLDFPDLAMTRLSVAYRTWSARVVTSSDVAATIELHAPKPSDTRIEIDVDLKKNVIVEMRTFRDRLRSQKDKAGTMTQRVRMSGFEKVANVWFATKAERFDKDGKLTNRDERTVTAADTKAVDDRIAAIVKGYEDVAFIDGKAPVLSAAKQAIHDRRASFVDHLTVVLHESDTSQWKPAWEAFANAEALLGGKPAVEWMRLALLSWSRRGEQLKRALMASAEKQRSNARWFLAQQLTSIARGHLQANERLALNDALRSWYFGMPVDPVWHQRAWYLHRADLLTSLGKRLEALALRRLALSESPDNAGLRSGLAAALQSLGETEEAIKLLARTLAEREKWDAQEAYAFYDRWASLLWQRRDLRELYNVLTKWTNESPEQQHPYLAWLSVLLFLGRENEVDAWVKARFSEKLDELDDPQQAARIGAAIQIVSGSGWNFYSYRIDAKWLQPLGDVAYRLANSEGMTLNLTTRILNHYQFRRSDAYRTLRKRLAGDLRAIDSIESMSARRLELYVAWLPWTRSSVDAEFWRKTTDRVRARWEAATDKYERKVFGNLTLSLLDKHGEKAEAITFLRTRLAKATDETRPGIAKTLFDRLLGEDWTAELEAELFALAIKMLPNTPVAEQRHASLSITLRRLADALEKSRRKALLGPPSQQEKLPRAELRTRQNQARRQARAALVKSFRDQGIAAGDWARPWYEIEALCFQVQSAKDVAPSLGEALELWSTVKKLEKPVFYPLRERCSLVMSYASVRPKSAAEIASRTLAFYHKETRESPKALDWHYETFRLLVALDRYNELVTALESWIQPAKVDSTWRIALGYLRAEVGKLDQAIGEFEAVAAIDELGPKEYQALANWYLATGNDAKREIALTRHYETMPEYQLSRLLYTAINRVTRSGSQVPEDLDPETLRILRVLLSKASYPQNYIWQLKNLYRKVKDHRILASLANGVLGHSAERAYSFLQQSWQLISLVHEEAACDAIAARITELAANAKGVDKRTLGMLEALVLRRASEVLNQPGQYEVRCLSAMKGAFRGEWSRGERLLMARFLAAIGKVKSKAFADEQLRQLHALAEADEPALDRLRIAQQLYRTEWAYGNHDAAIDGLEASLEAYREKRGRTYGRLARTEVGLLVDWLEDRAKFMKAEKFLATEIGRETGRAQNNWLTQRLFQVWYRCLAKGGTVSLGRGKALYQRARSIIGEALFKRGQDQAQSTLGKFLALHQAAFKNAEIHGAAKDLEDFAKDRLPELVTFATQESQAIVLSTATMIQKLSGPLPAMLVLIRRIETEPTWLRRASMSGWQRFAWSLAKWRQQAGDLGPLDERLTKIVLRELEKDLVNLQSINRSMYSSRRSYFWAAKRTDFERVAMKVIELYPDSEARQLYCARYLWHDLSMHSGAIDVLLRAEERGVLARTGREQLVTWLHERKRWAESLPILTALLETQPEHLGWNLSMIRALHGTDRDADALVRLDEVVARLKKLDRWNERNIAKVAKTCLDVKFWKRAVTYYEEVIPLHQRTTPGRGIGRGTLSRYYAYLARAWSALGNPVKAVDAASAAVVSWGNNQSNRRNALKALQAIVRSIKDLDAYVVTWNEQVKKTGLDAPLIRKTLGKVFLERREADKAIAQLVIARTLQPNDSETPELLVQAYDSKRDKAGACTALLESIQLAPRNLKLYESLAARYSAMKNEAESERAWTSLVEVLPNEAESHRELAKHREAQRNYAMAVVQWRQVVRVRTDEPSGWLSLAKALINAGKPAEAQKTLEKVLARTWDDRFGNVHEEARRLLKGITSGGPGR